MKITSKGQIMLQTMYRYGNPMTAYEIVKKSGIAYTTINKSLKELSRRNIVVKVLQNNKTYWRINPDIEP